jgi:hypothetical protein
MTPLAWHCGPRSGSSFVLNPLCVPPGIRHGGAEGVRAVHQERDRERPLAFGDGHDALQVDRHLDEVRVQAGLRGLLDRDGPKVVADDLGLPVSGGLAGVGGGRC